MILTPRSTPVLLAIAVLLSGCVGIPNYSVAIRNMGTATIDDAHVIYPRNSFQSAGGVLPPGAMAVHGAVPSAPPKAAAVEWTTRDGARHAVSVDVKRLAPRGIGQDFTIFFDIGDNDGVTVRFEPNPFDGVEL